VIRIVIDPGIFISALIKPMGVPGLLIEYVLRGHVTIIICPWLIEELQRVLLRAKFRPYFSEEQGRRLVADIIRLAESFDDPRQPARVTPDPHDDYLIALAQSSGADVLVAGDRHLTGMDDSPVRVMTPRQLLDVLRDGVS
jgi:uncharacterized protein